MAHRITIIGGGPGGYAAAFSAAAQGAKVTLIEKRALGGTCLHSGCIPTKSFKASAEAMETLSGLAGYGIQLPDSVQPELDLEAVVARKDRIRQTLQGGLEKTCAKLKINCLKGMGKIVSSSMVAVTTDEGQTLEVASDAVIIATGSSVLEIPTLLFDHKTIISSDDVLGLERLPQSMVILGGGIIGCELAFIFNAFGTKVTLVEGQNRLMPVPGIEEESAKLIQRELKKKGVACELGRTLDKVSVKENGTAAGILKASPFIENPTAKQQQEKEITADMVVVCVGRAANSEGLGLKTAGIDCDARGWILVDETLQTSLPNVYAIGDALGPENIMLAHVASMEGLCAVRNCLGQKTAMDYTAVPSATFTSPELGTVGLTEDQARDQGYDPKSHTMQFRELGKAQAMGSLAGFFKLIADKNTGKLLGAQLAGKHATDMIAEVTFAIQQGCTVHDIARTIHAHPTLAEGVYDVATHLAAECGKDN